MGGFAWVTLATNDSYSLGALVLAHSLKQVGTKHRLAVLVTPGVTNSMRAKLATVFDLVQEVNILDSKDESNLRLLKRPELGVTFTKLHCWRLTQFDKCVFLDADTLVLQNCDELFEREELSAAPDVGWPDCFNSGVFVYRPSNETYDKLVQFAVEKGSFDGGDQGLLNLYFSDWATKDISKHLPFIYNLCSTACYSYLPAFKQFGADAKIIHFIGSSKPWLQYFNTETRKVQPTPDVKHLEAILQQWWNIFCLLIHPALTPDMARSSSDVTHTKSFRTSPQPKNIPVWDPWEEYDLKQSFPVTQTEPNPNQEKSQIPEIFEPQIKPVESHNTNADTASHESSSYLNPESKSQNFEPSNSSCDNPQFEDCHPTPIETDNYVPKLLHVEPKPTDDVPKLLHVEPKPADDVPKLLHVEPKPANDVPKRLHIEPEPNKPSPPVPSNDCEAAAVCEKTLHTPPCQDKTDTGLAGAFAQLTLGAPRTAEQSALDDHLRRQGWEVGNIDYMGRDSFDNIWNKICQTLSAGLPEDAPKTTAPAAPPQEAKLETPKPQETQLSTECPQCPITQKPKEETPQCPLPPKVQEVAEKPKESDKPEIPQTPATPTKEVPVAPQPPIGTAAPSAQQPIGTPPQEIPIAPQIQPTAPTPPETLQPTPQPQTPPVVAKEQPSAPVAPQGQPPAPITEQPKAPTAPQTPPVATTEQPPAAAAPQTPPVAAKDQPPVAIVPQTPPLAAAPRTPPVAAPPAAIVPQTAPVAAQEQPPAPVVPQIPQAAANEQPPTPVVPQTPPVAAQEQPPTPVVPQTPPVVASEKPPTPVAEQPPASQAPPAEPDKGKVESIQSKPETTQATPQTPPIAAQEQPTAPVAATPQTPPVAAKEQPPTPVVPQTPPVAAAPQTPPVAAQEQPPTPVVPQTPPVAATEKPPTPVAEQPPPAAAASQTPPAEPGKGKVESKQSKPETTQGGASVASPTPPPRKGSGGGKKSKSKK
ncbi:proline-rich extensin-like protein EPR1 isoform X2 [Tribolium madens]|uniref:proline-rich extensin-like protein EPR1 isoform X2 n=1 Tax=Tribolium madens TaxID=41895 RepID=UPI001CF73E35|nr:proline-rich extensin-like protein EPR1 isoform X2 [Tribolium madens]